VTRTVPVMVSVVLIVAASPGQWPRQPPAQQQPRGDVRQPPGEGCDSQGRTGVEEEEEDDDDDDEDDDDDDGDAYLLTKYRTSFDRRFVFSLGSVIA